MPLAAFFFTIISFSCYSFIFYAFDAAAFIDVCRYAIIATPLRHAAIISYYATPYADISLLLPPPTCRHITPPRLLPNK